MTKEEAKRWIHQKFNSGETERLMADLIIQALEQEPILEKIRAEIEELDTHYDNDYFVGNKDAMFKCNEVLQIIDKYRGET